MAVAVQVKSGNCLRRNQPRCCCLAFSFKYSHLLSLAKIFQHESNPPPWDTGTNRTAISTLGLKESSKGRRKRIFVGNVTHLNDVNLDCREPAHMYINTPENHQQRASVSLCRDLALASPLKEAKLSSERTTSLFLGISVSLLSTFPTWAVRFVVQRE